MPELTVSLNCPSCGGTLGVEEGALFTNCSYCDALLHLEGEKGIFRTMFKNNLNEQTATEKLKTWFRQGLKARDLPAKAKITELYPIYLPFWRYNARAAGWVCGFEERRYQDSKGRTHTKRIDMERMVFRDYDWTEIACNAGDLGIKTLKNLQGEAVLHDEGSIPTFESTSSSDDARAKGQDGIRAMARSSANVPHITYEKIHVLPRALTLIFYPVWVGRYEYAGRSYFATLDGVTGAILSGRAPGDPLYRAIAMTFGSMAGGLLAGFGIGVGAGGEVLAACVILGVIMFGVTFLFFRHGGEITEGDMPKTQWGGRLP